MATNKSTELLNIIAGEIKKNIEQNFNTQRDVTKKWSKSQRQIEGTKAYQYSKYKSEPTLVNTGALRDAVMSSQYRLLNNNTIEIIIDNEYAQYHNEGSERLPQRKFIDFDSKTIEEKLTNYGK